MKRLYILFTILLIILITLTACGSSDPGPASWIDKPLDKSNYPLEPLEIIAHASSAAGVSSIEFAVDEQVINTVRVGNGRFEIASQIWHPKEPGVYKVQVTSTDTNGNRGSQAVSIVNIGDAGIDGLNQNGPGYGDCDYVEVLNFIAEPPGVPPGKCSNLFWEVISPEDFGVIVNGAGVPPLGEMQVCPGETTSFELIVESAAGMCRQWQTVYIDEYDLNGNEAPPEIAVFFEGHPPQIQSGECSVLVWEVNPLEGGETIIQGELVPPGGEMEVCPTESTYYELIAVRHDTGTSSFVMIEVLDGDSPDPEGDGITTTPGLIITTTSVPSGGGTYTPTPSGGPTDTPSPSPDTTPPSISGASVTPSSYIYNTDNSCSPTAFNFSVNVTDAGGVATVSLNWNGTGVRSGPENMNYSGVKYVKSLGLFVNTGSLSNFSITATDNSGNSSTIYPSWNLDIEQCGS